MFNKKVTCLLIPLLFRTSYILIYNLDIITNKNSVKYYFTPFNNSNDDLDVL